MGLRFVSETYGPYESETRPGWTEYSVSTLFVDEDGTYVCEHKFVEYPIKRSLIHNAYAVKEQPFGVWVKWRRNNDRR